MSDQYYNKLTKKEFFTVASDQFKKGVLTTLGLDHLHEKNQEAESLKAKAESFKEKPKEPSIREPEKTRSEQQEAMKQSGFEKAPVNRGLFFDGERLSYHEDGVEKRSWKAESGQRGYQTKRHQAEKNYGPIPEGKYHIKQSRYQDIDEYPSKAEKDKRCSEGKVECLKALADRPSLRKILGDWNMGPWKGGENSWGKKRVWIEADPLTNLFGREKFSIHGGKTPGSAGCVDLGDEMDDFADFYRKLGLDLTLDVKHKY